MFRHLELLTVVCNDFASPSFTPFLIMYAGLGLILSLYGTFRTHEVLPGLIYIICPFIAFAFFVMLMACVPQVGKVRILSGRVRGCKVKAKVAQRMHRSLKPFGVRFSTIGVVNFNSVLGIIEFSFNGTVGLLGS